MTLAFIIEDEPDLALIFFKALKSEGMNIEIISDGAEAAGRLQEDTPNLVVLDMHLPGMDGTEILARIRSEARFAETKVIVATADANMVNLVEKQADLVLLKPVSYYQLKDLSARLLIPH